MHKETTEATCITHPWCAEPGRHDDHVGAEYTVTDTRGHAIADVRVLYLSESTPTVGLCGADFTPAQARVKAVELRALADQVAVCADLADLVAAQAFTAARQAIDAALTASTDPRRTCAGLRALIEMTLTELRTECED